MKSILKNSSDSDGGKRILSSVAEVVRRLDEGLRHAKTVQEVLTPANNGLRLRLRELCEQMIVSDPEDSGRKAEDLLWRKVHYEPYSRAKQIGQTFPLGQYETGLLICHLLAGIGSYQQLTLNLETQLGVGGSHRVDLALCQPQGMTRETVTVRASDCSGQVSAWGQAALAADPHQHR
ncbi:protein SMG5-like [Pollicipes pollicipes]|uniref:protein SMG5-like n=1 Tax=Pollicipes pollicipes TaxID=41117 RepID=UPI001884C914|nr:protein SMG5-like [Pollicipes pollicipes]